MVKQSSVHAIILNFIRLILVLIFITSFISNSPILQTLSFLGFLITFIPLILSKYFKKEIPAVVEIIAIMFLYGLLFLGEVRGLYASFWWWDLLLNLVASIALGFIGLTIMYVLNKEATIDINPLFIVTLAFCFGVTIGTLWELFEFSLDALFATSLQKSLEDTMTDIIVNITGVLLVSILGFHYLRKGKFPLMSTVLLNILEKNKWILGNKKKVNIEEKVLELIKRGESEKLEFKSSFRINMHTKEFDERLEHEILKTITAFLNTNGGNLLVGIDDGGRVLGLEQDHFQSDDKLGLHLTNLIKNKIGNEFIPFIRFQIVTIKDKKILLIHCKESKKEVFVKNKQEEEFYIRNGPASIRLNGRSLIEYIKHKFEKNS